MTKTKEISHPVKTMRSEKTETSLIKLKFDKRLNYHNYANNSKEIASNEKKISQRIKNRIAGVFPT